MQIPVSEAKAQLTELVRRAEAGDEIILTRHGHPAVRLTPVTTRPDARQRRAILEKARAAGMAMASPGADAAHSQDELYGPDGMPA
jgi:prevent-host-death family protein